MTGVTCHECNFAIGEGVEQKERPTLHSSPLHWCKRLTRVKMLRVCLVTTNRVEVSQAPNGKWRVQGTGSDMYEEGISLFMQMFQWRNLTFYLTPLLDECLERMKNNVSDLASNQLSYFRNLTHHSVPVPFLPTQIEMLTGYNLEERNEPAEDTATVFTNFESFHFSVHLAVLFLMLAFLAIIIARITIHTSHRKKFAHLHSRRVKCEKSVAVRVCKQMTLVILGESVHFKLIALLCSILLFFLITSFNCLFKTTRVVVEEKFVVKTYEELLEHKAAMPLFFNAVGSIVDKFEGKPESDVHGKIWSKLASLSHEELAKFVVEGDISGLEAIGVLRFYFKQMNDQKSVALVPSTLTLFLKTLLCATSSGSDIWKILRFVDPSEPEEILGYGLSNHCTDSHHFERGMKRGYESSVLNHYYFRALDVRDILYELQSTPMAKRHKQNLVCDGESLFDPKPQVNAIPLRYFVSFIIALTVNVLFALMVLTHEKLSAKRKQRQSRSQSHSVIP